VLSTPHTHPTAQSGQHFSLFLGAKHSRQHRPYPPRLADRPEAKPARVSSAAGERTGSTGRRAHTHTTQHKCTGPDETEGKGDDGESRQTPSDAKPKPPPPADRQPENRRPVRKTEWQADTHRSCVRTHPIGAKNTESKARARSRRAPLRGTLPVAPRGVQRGGPAEREALHQSSALGSTARNGSRGVNTAFGRHARPSEEGVLRVSTPQS
jgi:hypothetical protein